jgi:tetratricopeptide (TPR) repeat protein
MKTIGSVNLDNLINICSIKLKNDPTNKKALYIRSSTYLKKGFYIDALNDSNRLIEIDTEYAGAYYIRGCALEKLN